jgi:5-deoxy-glucuronate isomerase
MISAASFPFPAEKRVCPPLHPASPLSWIAQSSELSGRVGLDFGLLRLSAGATYRFESVAETVAILLEGEARLTFNDTSTVVSRRSVFDDGPVTLSLGRGGLAEIDSLTSSEWAVIRTDPSSATATRLYTPGECATEDRGAGLAQDACRRLVRTIFDHRTRPDSAFVVGEVINLPGRWSSYPPHHHPQPEIYHYRFTAPQGYGHAEIGREVHRVENGDTTFIPGGLDHAQVSAPGYGMYYLWIVRHLPGDPYLGFTVTPEHAWLLDSRQQGWKPAPGLFA